MNISAHMECVQWNSIRQLNGFWIPTGAMAYAGQFTRISSWKKTVNRTYRTTYSSFCPMLLILHLIWVIIYFIFCKYLPKSSEFQQLKYILYPKFRSKSGNIKRYCESQPFDGYNTQINSMFTSSYLIICIFKPVH